MRYIHLSAHWTPSKGLQLNKSAALATTAQLRMQTGADCMGTPPASIRLGCCQRRAQHLDLRLAFQLLQARAGVEGGPFGVGAGLVQGVGQFAFAP